MKLEHMARMDRYVHAVEQDLKGRFLHPEQPQQILFDAMRYSLLAGGKRLRPVYVLEFCRLCGGQWETAIPFASAIEMVHTYSLIHDDLPCMDDDDLRRGRPTNHKVFGEANAVLAGDALLTAAFSTLCQAQLPAERLVTAVQVLSEAAGECGMVGGQVLDLASEGRACTEQEILDVQQRKTGALIEGACCLGVAAAGGSAQQMCAARDYAAAVGLAFQIRDDILDQIGSADELGKGVGKDQDKLTFVRLYGLERCQELIEAHSKKALDALEEFRDTAFLQALTNALIERNH